MHPSHPHNSGYTLLESLLFIAGAAVILLAMSSVLMLLIQSRVTHAAMTEVESQGEKVLHVITQSIRSADSITIPSATATSTSLSLATYASSTSPTVLEISNGTLRLTEGAGTPQSLTSPKIEVSDLIFTRLSSTSTLSSIRFSVTLTHLNPSQRNEYAYTRTFWGTASLR